MELKDYLDCFPEYVKLAVLILNGIERWEKGKGGLKSFLR